MRNNINITSDDKVFTYIVEYVDANVTDGKDIYWSNCNKNTKCIHLFEGDVEYFRHGNDWYNSKELDKNYNLIPSTVATSKLRVYIPHYNVNTYTKGIKYGISVNTWINGYKVDLGSFIFKSNDAVANEFGLLKNGNNEYSEHVEFNIINPFELIYSDEWVDFRNSVCKEPLWINTTGSILYVSLYVIDENNDKFVMNSSYVGGITNFNISKKSDFLTLNLSESLEPFGLKFDLNYNKEYNNLIQYLLETYNLKIDNGELIRYELVFKRKDAVIPYADNINDYIIYTDNSDYGLTTKIVSLDQLKSKYVAIRDFFSSWDNFEEGWNFVASLIVCNKDYEEIFNIVSNEIPITQEVFSRFIYGSERIVDKIYEVNDKIETTEDMNIIKFDKIPAIVNKFENKIVQLERPNNSKDNILQPVFFRVKDTETLTLHPAVTENICINLDDYKSKVKNFILQIGDCHFEQIGANKYGILFKVVGNKLSKDVTTGIYYILNENYELITTGKYNCVR